MLDIAKSFGKKLQKIRKAKRITQEKKKKKVVGWAFSPTII